MFDFAGFAVLDYSRAIAAERAVKEERAKWRWRLRDINRAERNAKDRPAPASGPRPLKGAHSPWI
ncbi:MAG: hypothetical protein HY874_05270 [Chloroflexi bacterium]|nr:hypothetical protein [Chloroflexota bacterium]